VKLKQKTKSKGRYGFDDYPDSKTNYYDPDGMQAGDRCPCCSFGKLYKGEARRLLEFKASSPIEATRHLKNVLRCNACGHEYMSHDHIGPKWHKTARSNIILYRVNGMPLERLSKMQGQYNTPLAPTTMFDVIKEVWNESGSFIYEALITIAAQSRDLYADDTNARILEVMVENKALPEGISGRACHTTVICAKTSDNHQITLYLTTRGIKNL
jgi:hypothetical protein